MDDSIGPITHSHPGNVVWLPIKCEGYFSMHQLRLFSSCPQVWTDATLPCPIGLTFLTCLFPACPQVLTCLPVSLGRLSTGPTFPYFVGLTLFTRFPHVTGINGSHSILSCRAGLPHLSDSPRPQVSTGPTLSILYGLLSPPPSIKGSDSPLPCPVGFILLTCLHVYR